MAEQNLPQESESQEIGQDAVLAFQVARPRFWRPTETDTDADVGLDFQVQVVKEGNYRCLFHAQIKGSRQKRADGRSKYLNMSGEYFSCELDTRTLNYYARIEAPIMLAFVDLTEDSRPKRCSVFYLWIDEELEKLLGSKETLSISDQRRYTFRIPIENKVTDDLEVLPYLEQRHAKRRALEGIYRAIEEHSDQPADTAMRIGSRLRASKIAIDSLLTDTGDNPWIETPEGSLAGRLRLSSAHLTSNNVKLAEKTLEMIEPDLGEATDHEAAEFYYQKGRALEISGAYKDALGLYEKACRQSPGRDKYKLAWAEARISGDYLNKAVCEEVLRYIEGEEGKKARLLRAKMLALLDRRDEALQQIPESEDKDTRIARAMVHFLTGGHSACLEICEEGLTDPSASIRNLLILRLIRARVLFDRGCMRSRVDERIPLTGLSTMDPVILRDAWDEVQECWSLASQLNYPQEVELLADISVLLGCYFEESESIYQHVKLAAKKHPYRENVQNILLNLAQHFGDDDTVERQLAHLPETPEKTFQRVGLLYRRGEKGEIVDIVIENLDLLLEKKYFEPAIETAALCAHELMRTSDRDTLLGALENLPNWESRKETFDYAVAVNDNILGIDDALDKLYRAFESGRKGREICEQLFLGLDPHDDMAAARIFEVELELKKWRALSEKDLLKLCQAGATLRRWPKVLELCDSAMLRFGSKANLKAVKARALDELGDTPKALALVEEVVEADRFDSNAFEMYAQIAARSGSLGKAKAVLERLYEKADNRQDRSRFVLMILKVEMAIDPMSERLLDYWMKYGQLNDRNDEIDEGTFLLLFFQIDYACKPHITEAHSREFRKRLAAYSDKFPRSKVLQGFSLPEGVGGSELLRFLGDKIGITEEVRRNREEIENQIATGRLNIPFALRPPLLRGVQDLLGLFELMKKSRKWHKQFQLRIDSSGIEESRLLYLQRGVPVIDDVSLLLLHELGLLHHLFLVFEKVAICRLTLIRFRAWAQSHFVSVFSERARALTAELTAHIKRIHQLPLTGSEMSNDANQLEALRVLLRDTKLQYFCDDVYSRTLLLEEESESRGITTVDLIEMLRTQGRLSDREAAKKIGRLCGWNVAGVTVRYLDIVRVLEGEIGENENVSAILEKMESNMLVGGFLEILWDIDRGYEYCLKECGRLLGTILAGPTSSGGERLKVDTNIVAAFWLIWHQRVKSLTKGESDVMGYCAKSLVEVGICAAGREVGEAESRFVSQRIWIACGRVLEELFGDRMSNKVEMRLVSSVARALARRDLHDRDVGASFLVSGLVEESRERELFNEVYLHARVKSERW